MTLKIIGPRALLTAAEIEDAVPLLGGVAHELPIHEVIHGILECSLERPPIVR